MTQDRKDLGHVQIHYLCVFVFSSYTFSFLHVSMRAPLCQEASQAHRGFSSIVCEGEKGDLGRITGSRAAKYLSPQLLFLSLLFLMWPTHADTEQIHKKPKDSRSTLTVLNLKGGNARRETYDSIRNRDL